MRIENWAVITPADDPYKVPELRKPSLQGKVFGHPRFEDGHRVTTSSIQGKTETGEVVTYSGSHYKLGQIDPSYEERFPGSRKKLLDFLPTIDDHVCPCCECNICECW